MKDDGVVYTPTNATISADPLSTLGCVPRGSGARLEAERIAPRSA